MGLVTRLSWVLLDLTNAGVGVSGSMKDESLYPVGNVGDF